MLHARYINGNLAFWDTHQNRIIDAIGTSVVKFIEDFINVPVAETTHIPMAWDAQTDDANDAFTFPVSLTGGVMQLGVTNTDNNETYAQIGHVGTQAQFVIGGAAGVANSKPLYFGARVKALEHADEAYFVGLAEEGAAAANFMADNSGVLADKDFVGFNTLTATPDAWNITWKKNGQAVQAVTGAAVNAADWHTFEFYYDGATTITFYVDGTANATTATTTATTFPGAEEMAPIIAVKTGEGVLKRLQIDWLRVVMFD